MPTPTAHLLIHLVEMKEGEEIQYDEKPIPEDVKGTIIDAVESLKLDYQSLFNETIDNIEPIHLDKIVSHYKKISRWNRKRREHVALLLGASLGQILVDSLGFEWIIFKDQEGEELAVRHLTSNWRAFPLSSVKKRIKTGEKGYFTSLYNSFKESTEDRD